MDKNTAGKMLAMMLAQRSEIAMHRAVLIAHGLIPDASDDDLAAYRLHVATEVSEACAALGSSGFLLAEMVAKVEESLASIHMSARGWVRAENDPPDDA